MVDVQQLHKELALLWLQNQNLSDITPEELLKKYQEAYNAIANEYAKERGGQRVSY